MKDSHHGSNQPRKIAVVIPKYGLLGGAERFAAEMTGRLSRRSEYEFHVLAHRWLGAPDSTVVFHKIPHLPFPRSFRPWAFAWFVQRTLNARKFDLVHSHDRIFHADIASLHCIPHSSWVRDIRKKRTSLFDRSAIAVEKRMIQSGSNTAFLPVSSIAREAFQSEYCNLPGQWQIMHPGVDFERFSSPERGACRAEIHGKYGLSGCDFVALFVGMNFELKGLDTVMESIAIARRQKPHANIELLVVGRGNEGKYRAKAQALGISKAVSFAGPISENIERYYRSADALMMLSDFDTFGMVVLEAMAAGLPVIIGPEVGARDLVEHGKNGFVLGNRNDSRAAADCLMILCEDEQWNPASSSARETARANDWTSRANDIATIYERHFANRSRE